MQVVPRLRNLSSLRISLASATTHFGRFHSTPVSNEKRKNKWNGDFQGGQQPSKNYIRYVTRQKRADAKRALRNMLFPSDAFAGGFQRGNQTKKKDETFSLDEDWEDADCPANKSRAKVQSRRAQKAKSRMKRRRKRDFFEEDDDHAEKLFQAKFGDRWYTWSFQSFDGFTSSQSTSGFEWRQYEYSKKDDRYKESESDSDEEVVVNRVGFHSERTLLGLPPHGPLKMEDVKKAFRSSALKWHPDKHQGASQGEAEEKFKRCVNAYNSLRSSLSTTA